MKNSDYLKPGERLDDLQYNDMYIIQSINEYSFTSDSVLLANFVKINPSEKALELCSGSGIIGILASVKNNVKDFTMLEIQPSMCDMSQRSVDMNNLGIKVVCGDIRKITDYFQEQSFGYVLANPPYKTVDAHTLSSHNNINMSRYEVSLTLEELVKNASKVIKYGGKFAMIYDSDRLSEALSIMTKYKLEPKKIQIVYPKDNRASHVFMVEAIKNGKSGLKVLPPMILG